MIGTFLIDTNQSQSNNSTTELILETASLVGDTQEFQWQIEELKHHSVYPRVESWLSFFNDHFSEFILSYSNTVFAVLSLAKDNQLFASQTYYEKELSFEFYKRLIKNSAHFQLEDVEGAKYLLSISLIYGRYHGMVIGSTLKELNFKNHRITKSHLEQAFENLFVKFENPRLLTERIDQLDLGCIELLMQMLQGNNPRTFPDLPLPLSRRESFYFSNSSIGGLELKNKLLEKTIVISKLLSTHDDSQLLSLFLSPNHFFNFRIKEFYNHLGFWKSAFKFISKINWTETALDIAEYVDYFMFKRHNEELSYSLKGRTQNSIERSIHQWHEYGYFGNLDELMKANWGKPRKDIILHNGAVFEFLEITNGRRLFIESERMNHCAFSYINMCKDGYTSVWSVSRKRDKVLKPILTLELQGQDITQVVRKNNQDPSKLEVELVKEWAKERSLKLKLSYPDQF